MAGLVAHIGKMKNAYRILVLRVSIQFNSIYFAFMRSRRGLFRPIGYRTCQFVYLIEYTRK
jgi:hypothetical protein